MDRKVRDMEQSGPVDYDLLAFEAILAEADRVASIEGDMWFVEHIDTEWS
jgi:hypothetical protein